MPEDATQGTVAVDAGHDDRSKVTTIIVNAAPYEVAGKDIAFEELVNLAYNNAPPTGDNFSFTVTYSRGEHGQEGTMLPGDRVKLKSKMVFDVSATDRS